MSDERQHSQRVEDKGWLCRVAHICSLGWDWIDKRQIFERFVSLAILFGTIKVMSWTMEYAWEHGEKSGLEAAAIIAAVIAPYMALQAVAAAFMFKART